MRVRAYAKINLGLEVLFRRGDGYHELRTIYQTIGLHDRLRFEPAEEGIEIVVTGADVPAGPENLAHRAAELLASETGAGRGARIVLEKNIPPGRGLGGGSADAALTLLALNDLWNTGLPPSGLYRLAARLGMDVPFFLVGGTALGIGRGEEVYPLGCQVDLPIVLILPEFAIETSRAYRSLQLTKREPSLKLPCFALACLGGREKLPRLVNDLESAAEEHSPAIVEYKRILVALGADVSLMSGSGSAVFGMFEDEAAARSAAGSLADQGIRAIATRTLTREMYRERRVESRPEGSSDP